MMKDLILTGVIVICLVLALIGHYFGWSDDSIDDEQGFPYSRRGKK
jgi:predicted Zn-dependent protease with MMP-like domain